MGGGERKLCRGSLYDKLSSSLSLSSSVLWRVRTPISEVLRGVMLSVRRRTGAVRSKSMGVLGAKPIVLLGMGDDQDDIEASSSINYLLTLIKINYILFTIVYLI